MCKHSKMTKIGEVKVCPQCGLTILPDGSMTFDREIIKYKPKRRKK